MGTWLSEIVPHRQSVFAAWLATTETRWLQLLDRELRAERCEKVVDACLVLLEGCLHQGFELHRVGAERQDVELASNPKCRDQLTDQAVEFLAQRYRRIPTHATQRIELNRTICSTLCRRALRSRRCGLSCL